jgi:light-regulated signal transduction histidine kinase (bacteriophytochrome)
MSEEQVRKPCDADARLAEELDRKNKELDALSYSISHDLRAPLRAIDGFSQALLEDCAEQLDEKARRYLTRVRAATARMAELIEGLLELARVGRVDIRREHACLSEIAQSIADQLRRKEPERQVTFAIREGLVAEADNRLLRVALDSLISNAWKFTSRTDRPTIEIGSEARDNETVYFIRDNGAGFNMTYASKLFSAFQRLHGESEFPGIGIGLALVHRIVDRHGGRVWIEGSVGGGATVFFTLARPRMGGST